MPDSALDGGFGHAQPEFRRISVAVEAAGWREWPELRPGVRIRVLCDGPAPGERTALLRYDPGAHVPRHLHPGQEWLLVLEGTQEDDTGAYGPGTWISNPPGTFHQVKSPDGCLVLIHWNAPVEFQAGSDGK
jgi:anti-sigma factor ChrR (cupin superfamily)